MDKRDDIDIPEPHDDGMDESFSNLGDKAVSAILMPLVFAAIMARIGRALFAGLMAVFRAAEWALRPRMIYATVASLLILSLTVIWAVSRANGF